MPGILFLVATPIGNLGDLSARAGETLASVDFVAAEDTRVSIKLLNHLGLKKPMLSYHDHNRASRGRDILERLLAGESCALVTDAGMPAISDPGAELTAQCAAHGIETRVIPGPCAAVSAVALSGFPGGRFTFEGFLSMNKRSRREHLSSLREERRVMIFYEAPHKLPATLVDLRDTFGPERRVAICREMTKRHEEVLRMTLGEAAEHYAAVPPRGEFVLVLEGAGEPPPPAVPLDEAIEQAAALIEAGHSLRDAVRQAAEETGVSRNELYASVKKREEARRREP